MELRIPDGEFLQYINGQQVEGASRTAAIVCPGNGEFVAKVRLASAEQAQAALESGKLNGHNAFEVDSLINYLTFFLEQAKCEQDAILRDTTGGKGFYAVVRQPLGVVVASLAWNFPLHNAATKLGPILASGCTAVIKPATKTPLSTLYLGRILDRIDFPKGVINLVAGDAGEISKTLSSRIPAMLTMIGSTQGGLEMLRDSATSVKRFSMELGGNAPVIVMDHNDFGVGTCGRPVLFYRHMPRWIGDVSLSRFRRIYRFHLRLGLR